MSNFPITDSHDHVVCIRCSENLKEVREETTGYPDGEFKKKCPECGWVTWYDIKKVKKD